MNPPIHLINSLLADIDTVHNLTQGIRQSLKLALAPPQPGEHEPVHMHRYIGNLMDLVYILGRHEQYLRDEYLKTHPMPPAWLNEQIWE